MWTKRDSTRAWPRLGATVRTSFSSITASMLVESNPCWITEEMVLSESPSFRSRATNSGSTVFLGSTGKGVCGAVGGRAGSGVTGGGGAGVGATCTGTGAAGATAAVCTGAGGAESGAAIERLGSETGMVGGGGRDCCCCRCCCNCSC